MKVNQRLLSIILAISFSIINLALIAQEKGVESKTENDAPQKKEYKTLLSSSDGNVENGGYLGLTLAYSLIDNEPSLQIGGRVAWVINHQFAMGIAGNGFFNNLDKSGHYETTDYFLAGGYGGLFLQPILFPEAPVHVSFPIILGVGGIAVNNWSNWEYYHWEDNCDDDYDDYDDMDYYYYYDSDVFLVFEPGIDIEFNMLDFMRMSVGASYRFTNSVNLIYEYEEDNMMKTVLIDPYSLNNFTFRIAMLFGWF